jgi:hypothetical protein
LTSKRELIDHYGREDEGVLYMVCPHCDPEEKFETLEAWKDHMQREHGGYTSSEVASGQAATEEAGAGARTPPPAPAKPKRMSAKARELNDKLNRCISLVLKHVISGITEEERQEMERSRTELTEAFIGIEFDFEERLFSLSGKWAVLVALVLLYTLPALPSMREAIAKSREKSKEKSKEKKE